jgi:hypothetical protein
MSGRSHKTNNYPDKHADLIFFLITVPLAVLFVNVLEWLF